MSALAQHSFNNVTIEQRHADGYLNATAMCQASGKLWGHYRSLASTQSFLAALSTDIGITISDLIQSVKGGNPHAQGTWVHPKVAIHLAQWLSPEFAVWCSNIIFEWMQGGDRSPREIEIKTPGLRLIQDAIYEMERTNQRVDVLEDRQDAVEQRLAQLDSDTGYRTVRGYCRAHGIQIPQSKAISLGRAAAQICRDRGLEVGSVADERHGSVNSYPVAVLREICPSEAGGNQHDD